MHYHNVFLIKAISKSHAIKLVEEFLEPYSENLEVEPYKVYLTPEDIEGMAKHYKFSKDNVEMILKNLPDWNGEAGAVDENGIYTSRTDNPNGEWDWYQLGGRWMWSDLMKKYEDKMYRPKTKEEEKSGWRTYWNQFHDEEVKGKLWFCQFPDGSTAMLEYGSPYALQRWVHEHPEYSEVIDATNENFWNIIKDVPKYKEEKIKEYKKNVKHWEDKNDKGMVEYVKEKLDRVEREDRWAIHLNFWNIEEDRFGVDEELIKKDPKHWFLVNVDLHS